MRERAIDRSTRGLLASSALLFALVGPMVPVARAASAVDTMTMLSAKQAERASAIAQLDAMRASLASELSTYTALCQQLGQARHDVSENATELATLQTEWAAAQTRLGDRAQLLYMSGGDQVTELLTSPSFQDFVVRADYLASLGESDAALVDQVSRLRLERQRMRDHLDMRAAQLAQQQTQAAEARAALEAQISVVNARASALGTDIASLVARQRAEAAAAALAAGGSLPTGSFDPNLLVADANYKAAQSMSSADIQAFLDKLPGTLKSYSAPDHNGVVKTTAQMIAEAAVQWSVSPKVILATLQKEQSLLEMTAPAQGAYDWAMGCGKADSATYYQYQGFGNQIWYGAQKLTQDGSGWSTGCSLDIDGTTVHPADASTYSLYRYTPHLQGTASFWTIYWRYFGDPTR